MGQTILTPAQHAVLDLFAKEENLCQTFYLTGGTALSEYYLQHRDSDDLDFFTETPADPISVEVFINRLTHHLGAASARKERVHDRQLFFLPLKDGELKIEFTLYPFPSLEAHAQKNGVLIDSLRDITTNKLAALLDRFEPKDFVDLYFLLQTQSLTDVQADLEKKFGIRVSPLALGGELAKVRRVEVLPKMRIPLTIEELKAFFSKLAKRLESNTLEG